MLNHSPSLAMSTSVLKALSCKLDIKRQSPSILNLSSVEIPNIIRCNMGYGGVSILTHTQNLVSMYLLEVSHALKHLKLVT